MSENSSTLLEVRELHSGYGEIEVLHGISAEVKKTEIVAIIGPNGAGKSTLFKTIFSLLPPTKGEILYLESDITASNPRELLRMGLAYVPQGRSTFPEMTVQENLEMGAFIKEGDITQDLSKVFARFPVLKEKRFVKAKNLSGGQQQMMEMGAAMLMDPDVYMLDEPSLGLAPKVAKDIFNRILELNDDGITFMIIEQNAQRALDLADRAYVIELGQNRFSGLAEDLSQNNQIQQLYLGGR